MIILKLVNDINTTVNKAKIWQFSSSNDLVIASHNLVICKHFKIRVFIVKNIQFYGGKKPRKLIIIALAQPTCLFLRVSMVAVMQHANLAHRAYTSGREGRRMMKKNLTWKGVLVLT